MKSVSNNSNTKGVSAAPRGALAGGARKVIFITGASAGIGLEMALRMLGRGHIVYGGARRVEKMQPLAKAGGYALRLDVTNHEQVSAAVERIIKEQGRIDVLVNSAGISLGGPVEEVPLDKVRQLFDVNFFGMVDVTQQVIPHMRKARKGLIVNVSSVAGKMYGPFCATYVAAKHAMEGWTDCLRTEMALFHVQVSIFQPGFIQSDIHDLFQDFTSEDSPYKPAADKHYQQVAQEIAKASPSSVVADALVHATEKGHANRRYVMGHMARVYLFLRTWLGDAFLDFATNAIFSPEMKKAALQQAYPHQKQQQKH